MGNSTTGRATVRVFALIVRTSATVNGAPVMVRLGECGGLRCRRQQGA